MSNSASGFLVLRRPDGFGDVYPLLPGQRYSAGRAPDNRIVLKDDLCSRHHAEVFPEGSGWAVRDLGSLNGTSVNDVPAKEDITLHSLAAVRMGRSDFIYVEKLDQLPGIPSNPPRAKDQPEGLEITRRLGQTKFLPHPGTIPTDATVVGAHDRTVSLPSTRLSHADALAILFRLALDMSEVQAEAELAELTIDALLRATPAEVGAVLGLKDARTLETIAYKSAVPERPTYHKVSQFVSREVLTAKQAILAEDISSNNSLRNRDSITDMKATSLICAPILFEGQPLGVLHLYRTAQSGRLNQDDLEFALAAAHQLGTAWHRARRETGLTLENQSLRDQLRLDSELIGESAALKNVEQQVARVAATKATVLIRGESGVGKELVARAIHYSSPRRESPFVCLNCAALTETLLESELFGHEKGSFTGATERMIGKFEASDTGTIFLDEIGEMNPSTQAKLLRVLEGHPFERVGGSTPIKVDVRVVAATNRPLEDAIRAGEFRRDLYFRLQVVQIDVPSLRDRPDDVPVLAEHFLKRFARETARKVKGFTPGAIKKMQAHQWPGNVRELRNVIERAVALGSGSQVEESDIWLSPLEAFNAAPPAAVGYEAISMEELERRHIQNTLEHTDWNKSRAAEILGIERSTLDRKIKTYEIKK
ncbi:sigma 54-interacting transcriptional regulator [Fimbriiglobus ruber]|uniref:Two-component system response regulator (Ntr family) n=1 Tax=Fimbriiglobus ruber TaxID=1908690 RepID=A0A225E8X1_9BACT|nr:sigma 54-interacting transcriptional regulator [Fimbriiglobus ruber]OWK47208.1 two-component system response regulator (Ntr family) [Fimbriiglobus ruber]